MLRATPSPIAAGCGRRSPLALALSAVVALAACGKAERGPQGPAGTPGEPGAPGEPAQASIAGVAALPGPAPTGGTTVTLGDTGRTVTTGPDGSYAFDGVAAGTYALRFVNGGYEETIPAVAAVPGAGGFVVDGGLAPLAPLEIPRGKRLFSGEVRSLAVTPDGAWAVFLAVAAGGLDLHALSLVDAGDVVYGLPGVGACRFAVSPRSDAVAFADACSGPATLTLAPLGGAPVPVASGVRAFDFAPDGSLVFVAAGAEGGQALHVVPPGGGAPRALLQAASVEPTTSSRDEPPERAFAFSPDGALVLALTGRALRVVALADGAAATVAEAASPADAAFSSDGARVLFAAETSPGGYALAIYALTGGTTTTLATGVLGWGHAWAPDGTHVVYLGRSDLWPDDAGIVSLSAAPAAGGAPALLATDACYPQYRFAPDGARVLLMRWLDASRQELVAAAADGSGQQVLASGSLGFPWDARFAGAEWVTYLGAIEPASGLGHLAAVPAAGGPPHTLGTQVVGYVPSADGARLALLALAGDRSLYAAAASPGSGAGPWLMTHADVAAWLPDGRLLVTRTGSPAPYRFQDGLYLADPR